MDGSGAHHVDQNKPDLERQILHVLPKMWNFKNNHKIVEERLLLDKSNEIKGKGRDVMGGNQSDEHD